MRLARAAFEPIPDDKRPGYGKEMDVTKRF